MLFSLLIAHYNNYHFFKECYQSILKQTHQNFEIILVDDCSTDGSLEKLVKLTEGDSRIKIYKNEENKGVGFTKRRCAENATGEICGFVDPDDAISPNALERSLKEYTNPEVIATHSNIAVYDEQMNYLKPFAKTAAVKNGDKMFFNINFEVNHFFTFRRQAYNKSSGINEMLTSAVDQDLYLKLYDLGHFKYIGEALYLYRLHDNGVSQNKSKKKKLNSNWHTVLHDTLERRAVTKLYGKKVSEIENLPAFIFKKQNTLLSKFLRKIK